MSDPEFDAEEAVARFFPRSQDYDHGAAKRLIKWLDNCGYAIVPKSAVETRQSHREAARTASETASPVLVEETV